MRAERSRWLLACNLLVILTVSSGLAFYNLSVYMSVLSAQRGFSVASVSNAVGVFFLTGGIAGIWVGRVLQTTDVRRVILVGTLIAGGAIAFIGRVEAAWQLYVVYALFGLGYTCAGLLPATTLITRWFDARQRPLALSFTSTGLSLGGIVITPLSVWLLAHWPLEQATPVLGAVFLVVIAPIAWFGLRPFSARAGADAPSGVRSGTAYALAVRSRFFVALTAGYLLALGTQVGVIAHLYNRGVAIVTPLQASFAVSILATFAVAGRFFGGAVLGRVPMKAFALANLAGQLAGFLILGHATDRNAMWLGAGVFGFTVGNLLMMQPLMLAQAFGVMDYPKIYSTSQAVTTVGVALGPVALGLIYVAAGYPAAFSVFALLSGVAFVLFVAAGPMPDAEAAMTDPRSRT